MNLIGRQILITGGTRGIGFAIAHAYLSEGARVYVTGRTEASVNEGMTRLRNELQLSHPCDRLFGGVLDVRNSRDVDASIVHAVELLGDVDVLVNNAGMGGGGPTLEVPQDLWYDIIDVNLHGTYRMTVGVLQRSGMLKRGWGRIINMASTGGKQGVQFAAAYTASKHGVVGFSKSLGIELAKTGVTVNAICPGFVETEMARTARTKYAELLGTTSEDVQRRFEARIPIGRYVLPQEVAPLAVLLASELSSAITAQAINVCGGLGNY